MTYRLDLWHVASGNHGIVTTAQAEEVGVLPVELRKLAARGALTSIARGVYRHQVPGDRFTDAAAAVALAGPDAVLEWDSVLPLYDLALMDPPFVYVSVPHR